MSANEHDIQGELRLLHAAVGSAAERLTQTEVGLRSEIELLKIELETLRRFLERHHPDFIKTYPHLRQRVIRTSPEFSG